MALPIRLLDRYRDASEDHPLVAEVNSHFMVLLSRFRASCGERGMNPSLSRNAGRLLDRLLASECFREAGAFPGECARGPATRNDYGTSMPGCKKSFLARFTVDV